ncbi:hypothetical protein F4818DRAFT_413286 [Hypoxylon cercidicola]|nr:hypothetical protein F4818DRAFT_413286 [Hypoxylon cercidicola]
MGSALSDKDVNQLVQTQNAVAANKDGKPTGPKSLEYHRQVLQSKLEEEKYGANATNATINNPTVIATTTATTTSALSTATYTNDAASRVQNNPQSRLLANVDAAGDRQNQQYISPSDNIMSPCTAKLNALKGRVASRAKPKSLFAQTSAKKFDGENVFGAKAASAARPTPSDQSSI